MCYIGRDSEMQYGNVKQNFKPCLSSDSALQLERLKQELLVIVDKHATVNTYIGLVHTARQATGAGFT